MRHGLRAWARPRYYGAPLAGHTTPKCWPTPSSPGASHNEQLVDCRAWATPLSYDHYLGVRMASKSTIFLPLFTGRPCGHSHTHHRDRSVATARLNLSSMQPKGSSYPPTTEVTLSSIAGMGGSDYWSGQTTTTCVGYVLMGLTHPALMFPAVRPDRRRAPGHSLDTKIYGRILMLLTEADQPQAPAELRTALSTPAALSVGGVVAGSG